MHGRTLLIVCAFFTLAALVLTLASPIFLGGALGWVFAAIQLERLRRLSESTIPEVKSNALDVTLLMLSTVILGSGIFSAVGYFQEVLASGEAWSVQRLQNEAYSFVVLFGGWTLGWFPTARRVQTIRESMSDDV